MASAELLAETLGVQPLTLERFVIAARETIGIRPKRADELLLEERSRGKITSGSVELDTMLGGGFWTGEITELVGAFGSGKTQVCMQLCANVQLSEDEGGLNSGAFFLDTEGTFSPGRLAQMAAGMGLDPRKALEKVIAGRAFNVGHLLTLIHDVKKRAANGEFRVLVVDSFASHFRSEFIGKDRLIERQQRIMSMAEELTTMAATYQMAVIVTNQVVANVDDYLYGNITEPALGYAWAHRPQQRVFLRKSRGNARIGHLFDSSRMPEQECVFYVTAAGICDDPHKTLG